MVWGRRQSCSYHIRNGKNRMLSFLRLQRDFEEGNWLLAADFYLSFFAAAVCILVGLAFVLSGINMAKPRGISHGHRQSNQRRCGQLGVGCSALWGSMGPSWGGRLGEGRLSRCLGMFSHCGGESGRREVTGVLLEPIHLPSWARGMRAAGEEGLSLYPS